MSDSADEIARRMEDVRREVSDDVRGIVETAKTLSDWRYYVKNHPWACVGLAVGLGFVIAPRKRAKSGPDTQELIALLKKYNVSVAQPQGASPGVVRTLIGLATPLVMRTVMNAAQQRFSGTDSILSSFFPARGEEEISDGYNIPR
jgi:hypothetical protein